MQHAYTSTMAIQVNTLEQNIFNIPDIFSRDFDKKIAEIGKANHIYIDVYKELRAGLGKLYHYVMQVVDLTRRYGYGCHCSHIEFIEHSRNTISDRTLKRRKVEAKEYVVTKPGVKNRTYFYPNKQWFYNFLNDLFIKLGIQQGQSGLSHIISNDPLGSDLILKSYPQDFETITKKVDVLCAAQEYERAIDAEIKKPKLRLVQTKQKPDSRIQRFSSDQLAVFDKLVAMKIYKRLAAKWVYTYTIAQLNNLIEATKQYCISGKPYAYMAESIKNLEIKTEVKIFITQPLTPTPSVADTEILLHDDNSKAIDKKTRVGHLATIRSLLKKSGVIVTKAHT